mmetsp:Transcript_22754/g.37673  ORF Transcript_22754/g.37673 Transcript_22754/m.37673 type:complete len:462 (+) Transcript_22754:73-1458(+)
MALLLMAVLIEFTRLPHMPKWSWDKLSTFCFPGCDPSDNPSVCPQGYTDAEVRNYAKFDLVLVQGRNFTRHPSGTWRADQEAQQNLFARRLHSLPPARPVFPYIGFYAPQAWYESQARFNDPAPQWEAMWMRDSNGEFASMTGHGVSCCSTSDEGGNYDQFPWRRLYDWRAETTRHYLVQQVINFVLDNPHFSGIFFDDVDSVATIDIQCSTAATPCATCKCECGHWTDHDRQHFVNSTLETVEMLLQTMAANGKLPILSTAESGCPPDAHGKLPSDCKKGGNPHGKAFTLQVAALLRQYGGFRFREAYGSIASSTGNLTIDSKANSDFLDGDLRFLLSQADAGTPHLVHGHGDESNTLEYLLAAFLIVMSDDWYFSASGWTAAQDPRFSDHEWGERSFPYLDVFDRPLGPPKSKAVETSHRVWRREFEHATVELRVDCVQKPRNCSTLVWQRPVRNSYTL